MDGEANELELERLLSKISDDEALRQTWMRYSVARSVATNQPVATLSMDISRRVQLEIKEMEATGKPAGGAFAKLLRPVASFAVAASVAATVVIGGQQLALLNGSEPYDSSQAVAVGGSPVGLVNSLGATSVQASYGTKSVPVLLPATRTAYRELARQRMQRYMQEHAEQAALNSPQGLIPFARVPRIEE